MVINGWGVGKTHFWLNFLLKYFFYFVCLVVPPAFPCPPKVCDFVPFLLLFCKCLLCLMWRDPFVSFPTITQIYGGTLCHVSPLVTVSSNIYLILHIYLCYPVILFVLLVSFIFRWIRCMVHLLSNCDTIVNFPWITGHTMCNGMWRYI